MATYRTVKTLSPTVAAYIAGLIDGEGTVTLTRKHKNENRALAVSVCNTEKQLLDYMLKYTGAGKITNKRTSKAHHTPSFTYAIHNRQALSLPEQILPYLQSYKVKRASLILKDYIKLTPRNGKYTNEQKSKKIKFENQVLGIKANPASKECD